MGWAVGYDEKWQRDIGYGVPAVCDDSECNAEIHRGLSHVCGGDPYGGECGCGLFFCGKHLWMGQRGRQVCARCNQSREPFEAKPDAREWLQHKLTDPSWAEWREAEPEAVREIEVALTASPPRTPADPLDVGAAE